MTIRIFTTLGFVVKSGFFMRKEAEQLLCDWACPSGAKAFYKKF